MKNLVWRLLRKNISVWQLAGYALASFVGLAIVVCAIRFYTDISTVYSTPDSFISKDYMIISKPVSTLTTIGMAAKPGFDQDELRAIERQPWARRVGKFTSANFNVGASVDFGGQGMSTFLFLESIPDEFLDVKRGDWQWQPGDARVPVIISKDYLALYNFGFAAGHGLPQLSEGLIGNVPLMLTLSGNGQEAAVPARIVGFSSRLNTIAVPETFMDWANGRFSAGEQPEPSRLIIEVSKPGDPAIDIFMEQRHYEVAGDKASSAKTSYFLTLVTSVVVAVGIVISALALFILMLSIFLLLQKNREKLHRLMQLGYSPRQVSRPYCLLVAVVNGVVLVLALAAMFAAAAWWQPQMRQLGAGTGRALPAVLWAVGIMAAVTGVNILTILRLTRRSF